MDESGVNSLGKCTARNPWGMQALVWEGALRAQCTQDVFQMLGRFQVGCLGGGIPFLGDKAQTFPNTGTLNDELYFLSPAVTLSWIWELFPQMFDSLEEKKKRYLKTRIFPSSDIHSGKHVFVWVFTAVVSSSEHTA